MVVELILERGRGLTYTPRRESRFRGPRSIDRFAATKIVQKLSSLLAAEGRYIGPAGLGDGDFQVSCPILLRLARHYGTHGTL